MSSLRGSVVAAVATRRTGVGAVEEPVAFEVGPDDEAQPDEWVEAVEANQTAGEFAAGREAEVGLGTPRSLTC